MSAAGRNVWALIAVKPFAQAKSRLAGALDREGAARLAAAMLEDVLDALSASEALCGALVVTSDPEAVAIARRTSAAAMDDTLRAGLNPALTQGLRHLTRWGATRAIVVPADLPLLTGDETRTFAAEAAASAVTLCPAERDGGTNLLALSPLDAIAPAFGADSLNRHAAAARAAGFEPKLVRLAGGGVDIDVPADLDLLAARGARTRAGAALRDLTAGSRQPAAERMEHI